MAVSLVISLGSVTWGSEAVPPRSLTQKSEADVALDRLAKLKDKAKVLKPTSTPHEVQEALGEPVGKETGGWSNMDVTVWRYLDYVDDDQAIAFRILFEPKRGCFVVADHWQRATIEKRELKVRTGTVTQVDSPVSGEVRDGFLCNVRFDDGTLLVVGAATMKRVKGVPEVGARITIRCHQIPLTYFVGANSLYLESIEFTRPRD